MNMPPIPSYFARSLRHSTDEVAERRQRQQKENNEGDLHEVRRTEDSQKKALTTQGTARPGERADWIAATTVRY